MIKPFDTLKENIPKALVSVQLATIRHWENRMVWWVDIYRSGMETQDVQLLLHVRKFSSTEYMSRRCIPEHIVRAYDQ
ncbi:hypothetical protein B0H11DRAFT_1746719 [Mycena galericulata]|nr:hypothetical protein B0H11DRAFT_1746719 [Mycena galericulata]